MYVFAGIGGRFCFQSTLSKSFKTRLHFDTFSSNLFHFVCSIHTVNLYMVSVQRGLMSPREIEDVSNRSVGKKVL